MVGIRPYHSFQALKQYSRCEDMNILYKGTVSSGNAPIQNNLLAISNMVVNKVKVYRRYDSNNDTRVVTADSKVPELYFSENKFYILLFSCTWK